MVANIQAYLENLQQPWGQLYYDILFEQLQDIKGKRVLDFGSGFGLVANHLAKENQVLAVEPNEEMVALRAQDHPYQQLVGSLDQLANLEDASFDVILCHNVLEYVEDRKLVLEEFTRLLKPDGLLSIVKHNEVGRVLQTVVFENDTRKALNLLAGQDLETHSMGLAQAYDLDAVVEDLALEVKNYQGIRVFYGLQDNRFKGQEGWRESMLQMELAVCQEPPYRDMAFFQHYWLTRS
ncbi:class I SAM-dependent methyltransferase [Streptococcus ilei]|uniref:class I SAM-dependent methyltransferase n=1 Tax=Streptococcus ilei TaxID=1156431 RepID=UPI000E448E50|nr:class I SAM-dependent methyltransferase [Streptococcus ilei]RGM73784.1 class I SAM-dependent methyltransferase [Streptococcus ilei]